MKGSSDEEKVLKEEGSVKVGRGEDREREKGGIKRNREDGGKGR